MAEESFQRSNEQRRKALVKANTIRTHRAELKRRLKEGDCKIAEVVVDPLCQTMKVFDVLLAVPKYGRVKVNRLLLKAAISPSKTVQGLTERQREQLFASLPDERRPVAW